MTRPQGAAERFVSSLPPDLRARLTPVYSPLVGIEPVATGIDFGDARGLIFTSANGVSVAAGLSQNRDLPCYCVGEATTRAAVKAEWRAECAGSTSRALISTLSQSRPGGPLLHIRGVHSRGDIAAQLTALGCPTGEKVIYDQPLLPLSEEASRILAGPDAVIAPLFSPRSARQFANLVADHPPLYIAALSQAVAEQVKGLIYKKLLVASQPNADTMMQLVEQLADTVARVEGDRPAQ